MSETREKAKQQSEMSKLVQSAIKEITQDKTFLKTLAQMVATEVSTKINAKLVSLENEFKTFKELMNTKITTQEKDIKKLEMDIEHLKLSNDNMEQALLGNKIRLYGVPENNEEDINSTVTSCFNKIIKNLNVSTVDIEYSYRVGKNITQKPRPIVVAFNSSKTKTSIFSQKKLFVNTGIFAYEELTKSRMELINKAKEKYGKNKAWSNGGRIFVRAANNVKQIKCQEDL